MSDSIMVLLTIEAAVLIEALLFYPVLLWHGRTMYRQGVSDGEHFGRVDQGVGDGSA